MSEIGKEDGLNLIKTETNQNRVHFNKTIFQAVFLLP